MHYVQLGGPPEKRQSMRLECPVVANLMPDTAASVPCAKEAGECLLWRNK